MGVYFNNSIHVIKVQVGLPERSVKSIYTLAPKAKNIM